MKAAVVFPGIGYHTDKPLLYYSKKIAREAGFEIIDVNYGGFESGIKGNPEKMKAAFQSALEQSIDILKTVDFQQYEKILFLSKSVGTAVASVYAMSHNLSTANVFYTPVEASFQVMKQPGIIFHGTKDPWLDHNVFLQEIKKTKYPYYLTEDANHSLETGNARKDIENMSIIMEHTEKYIKSL